MLTDPGNPSSGQSENQGSSASDDVDELAISHIDVAVTARDGTVFLFRVSRQDYVDVEVEVDDGSNESRVVPLSDIALISPVKATIRSLIRSAASSLERRKPNLRLDESIRTEAIVGTHGVMITKNQHGHSESVLCGFQVSPVPAIAQVGFACSAAAAVVRVRVLLMSAQPASFKRSRQPLTQHNRRP
jgi:hypothetical protein